MLKLLLNLHHRVQPPLVPLLTLFASLHAHNPLISNPPSASTALLEMFLVSYSPQFSKLVGASSRELTEMTYKCLSSPPLTAFARK